MPYAPTISASKHAKALVFGYAKYGRVCFYCKTPFVEELEQFKPTLDHLNGDETNNVMQNLVPCHLKCNNDKKTNPDMQILGKKQYQENCKDPLFWKIDPDGEREGERNKNALGDEVTDAEVNRITNKTIRKFLEERIPEGTNKTWELNDAANCICNLVQEDTGGRGAVAVVRRQIDVFCCTISKFEIDRTKRPFVIRRRN